MIAPLLAGCDVRRLTPNELVGLIDNPLEIAPAAVICGQELKDPPPLEAAQLLRSQLQDSPIYMIIDALPEMDRRSYIKNGFTDMFSLRLDMKLLTRAIAETAGVARGVRAYRQARLLDIEPGQSLEFDTAIYLPGNQKYIRLTQAGDSLDAERIDRFREHGLRSLYVPLDQMKAYNAYAASRLRSLAVPGGGPAVPHEKLVHSVRELLSGVVMELEREGTFAEGRAVMTQAGDIVKQFIKPSSSNSVYDRIMALSDEEADAYCHSMNVSTIATLLALGTGLANPEHMALAGLLHDAGATKEDADLEAREPSTLGLQDRVRLYKHVPETLEIIRKKKILLPTQSTRAIAEHHERYDGSGYPDSKVGAKICKEATLLGIADTLDRATAAVPGRYWQSIPVWVRMQRERLAKGAKSSEFDPDVLAKVLALFP